MSARLPRVSAVEVIKVLETIGFVLSRQSGSHKIYKNNAGKRVTVPYHGIAILKPKTLKSILVDAGLSVEELIELLRNYLGNASYPKEQTVLIGFTGCLSSTRLGWIKAHGFSLLFSGGDQ